MERTRCVTLCCIAAVGLAGCGGSDDPAPSQAPQSTGSAMTQDGLRANTLGRKELPQLQRMLDRLIAGVNARDTSICTEVYTPRYREELLGRKGDAALTACRSEVKRANIRVALDRVERVEIRDSGDALTGTVQVIQRIGTDGQLRVKFDVVRAGGAYRINGADGKQLPPAPDADAPRRRSH